MAADTDLSLCLVTLEDDLRPIGRKSLAGHFSLRIALLDDDVGWVDADPLEGARLRIGQPEGHKDGNHVKPHEPCNWPGTQR